MVCVDLDGDTRKVVTPGAESFEDGKELLFRSRVVDLSSDHFPGVEGYRTLNSVDCCRRAAPMANLLASVTNTVSASWS
jgi:hypothetical protein